MKLIYEDPVATCIDSIVATITYDITDDWGRTRYDQEMQFTGSQTELRKRLRDLRIMGATNIEVDTEPCFYENMNEDTDKESNKRDIMDLLTSERVDLMIDLWNDPKFTGGVSTERAMQYWENKGWDTSKYTPEEFNRVWDLAQDELDAGGYVNDEDDYEEEIETKEDAYRWLQSKLAEYGNTYHFPQEERIKLDRLIDRFGNTYFWSR